MEEDPETLKYQRFGVFPYVLESENVLIYRALHLFPSIDDDETAVSTSDMSTSRSSLKRSEYLSNVIATAERGYRPKCVAEGHVIR